MNYRRRSAETLISFFLIICVISIPGMNQKAHAGETDSSAPGYVDFGIVEEYLLEYDYDWFENSPVVGFLQYWLRVSPLDHIYGPATFLAHRESSTTRGIIIEDYFNNFSTVTFPESVERWRIDVISAIAVMGGPAEDLNKFLRVMQCESMGYPDAYNVSSGASGLMQHLERFWPPRAEQAGYLGASPFEPLANIYTSAWLLYRATGGGWQHWVCQ